MMQSRMARMLAWSSALAFALTGVAQAQRTGITRQVSLPQGSVLRAELIDHLSSQDSKPGDRFAATIRADRDGSGLPTGTQVLGQVRSVRRASERQPGLVDVEFTSLRLPDGRSYPIDASLTSLDAKNVRRTSSGRLEATSSSSSSKDQNKFIGYGAGAGAIIAALTDRDLLMGGLLGAAAGYLYGQLNKDKETRGRYSEVDLKAGTEFGVLVDEPMTVSLASNRSGDVYTRAQDRYPRYDGGSSRTDEPYRSGDIRVLMNDRDMRFRDARPFMSSGRVMLPLEAILDETSYRYRYDSARREVTVYGDRGDTRLTIGDYSAWVDGRRVRLDAPAQRIDGVIYVPVQFLEEATDIRAFWDADGRTLTLTTSQRASLPPYNDYRVR